MPQLAYILSASHSGSTLLAMLIGAHPDACTVGELKATSLGEPETYRCSCRALIHQCEFWCKINSLMRSKGHADFDITRANTSIHAVQSPYAARLLRPLMRGPLLETVRDAALAISPDWRKHLKQVQQRNYDLIYSVYEIAGCKVLVDSSKMALRLKYLVHIPGLDIKVIRLVRDGRAVALTYTDEWAYADASDPALRSGGTGIRKQSCRSMHDAAREWRRSNEAADCMLKRLSPDQWIQVKYEELCLNPELTLRKVSQFLGLAPEGVNLSFRAKPHHVIGNGMRMDSASEIRLDERWRGQLTPSDLATFNRVAGNLNREYGYV
jgi:hypothetical protein